MNNELWKSFMREMYINQNMIEFHPILWYHYVAATLIIALIGVMTVAALF